MQTTTGNPRAGALLGCALILCFAADALQAQDARSPIEASKLEPAELAATRQSTNGPALILRTGIFDPTIQRLAVSNLALEEPPIRYGLVQFEAGIRDGADRLRKAGLEVIAYQPQDAWLVRWNRDLKQRAEAIEEVRFIGDFQAAMKLAPAVLEPRLLPLRQARLDDASVSPAGAALEVVGFPGASAETLAAAARKFDESVRLIEQRTNPRWPTAVVWVPHHRAGALISRLTGLAQVYQVDDAAPLTLHNSDSVEPIQANTDSGSPLPGVTPLWDRGLIGTGQIVAVMDSGLDRNEDWFVALDSGSGANVALTDAEATVPPAIGMTFPDRKLHAYWVQPGATAYDNNEACLFSPTSFHGTHVSGTVAGDSLTRSTPLDPGYDADDGMAPNAQILFQDVGNDNSGCLSIVDFGASLRQAAAGGASIHNNSWGASVGGAYNANSAILDAVTRAEDRLLVTVSAGNSGSSLNTIGAPATAKNALTVGALLEGNSTTVAGFSSRGPTDDGRIKPDIQAPGSSIESARGDTNNGPAIEPAAIRTLGGTSMSNPTVAGGAALLRQYFTDGFYPSGERTPDDEQTPGGALLKAMLLNGTRADAGFNVPSNSYGWGRIWLDNNLYFPGDPRYFRRWQFDHANGLATGEANEFSLDVAAGEEFRVTLAWYDVAGALGSGVTLVNDLDLEVTAPGGEIYRGNVFSAASQSDDGGSFDRRNTVEQVLLPTPAPGEYRIRVIGHAVPGSGEPQTDRQGYALVASAATPPGSPPPAPANVTATDQGTAGIELGISPVAGAGAYSVYRAVGDCTTQSLEFQPIGQAESTVFADTGAIGGFTYSYRVRADEGAWEGALSTCTSASVATSTGPCELAPTFDQTSVVAEDSAAATCAVDLAWDAGSASCPLGEPLRYNVYRSSDPLFEPGPVTLLAPDRTGTGFIDANVLPETTYYYVVRAEDGTDPIDGNQSTGTLRVPATSFGAGSVPATFEDGADDLSLMQRDATWSISDDHAASGTFSYRSAPDDADTYTANTCATLTTPPIQLQAGAPTLSFHARYDIESSWDGVVLEISTDGGANWTALTPDGGYPGDFSLTQNPPINACGYAASQGAFNGSTGGQFENYSVSLDSFSGQTVQLRWVLSTDPGTEEEGFYLDDVEITEASMPAACLTTDELFIDGFETPL